MVNSDFHHSDSELKIIELYSILSSFTCMHVWPVLWSQRHRMIWTAVQNNNVYVLSFQGYFLLFESMLDSVLYARDLYLADTGSGWSHLLLTIGLGIYIYIFQSNQPKCSGQVGECQGGVALLWRHYAGVAQTAKSTFHHLGVEEIICAVGRTTLGVHQNSDTVNSNGKGTMLPLSTLNHSEKTKPRITTASLEAFSTTFQ